MSKKKKNLFKTPKQDVFVSPGSLTYIGKEVMDKTHIVRVDYNEVEMVLKEIKNFKEVSVEIPEGQKMWLDIDGVHEIKVVKRIGDQFGLHPLLLEDVLNTTQKPKIEFFEEENQLFVVLKMLHLNEETFDLEAEQISLVLGKNYVVSFQERDQTDIFRNIYDRIKFQPAGRIRKYNSDYLLYALLDLIIDHYFLVMEKVSDRLEELEEQILNDPKQHHQILIYNLKKELTFMKRIILPVRDILGTLIRENSDLVGTNVNVYLRDAQDHVLQILESLDTYRELADNVLTSYQSSLSNKMNSVMKTLTVFTVIFMPLSFIAGLYGMNFANMPELQSPNGYYYSLISMALIAVGLFLYFKWKSYL